MPQIHIIERAYELAESGQYRRPYDLRQALKREGYAWEDMQHLQGRSIIRDLGHIRLAALRRREEP